MMEKAMDKATCDGDGDGDGGDDGDGDDDGDDNDDADDVTDTCKFCKCAIEVEASGRLCNV